MEERQNYQVDYAAMKEVMKELAEKPAGNHPTANLANAAALIYDWVPDINWAGFYMMEAGQLVLGPFQGKVARVEIRVGSGVCGTAVAQDRTQRVPNVHDFEGHIACDCTSNAEIVVPIRKNGEILGVLDIDSTCFDRFSEEDQAGLEGFAEVLAAYI